MTDKELRKRYRIKPKIRFEIDSGLFVLIPTLMWQTWKYRWSGSGVIYLCWLNFVIAFGIWERRGGEK